jgi:hypothetical protein
VVEQDADFGSGKGVEDFQQLIDHRLDVFHESNSFLSCQVSCPDAYRIEQKPIPNNANIGRDAHNIIPKNSEKR